MKTRFNANIQAMESNPAAVTCKRVKAMGAVKQRYDSSQTALSRAVLFNDALLVTAQHAAMRNSGQTAEDLFGMKVHISRRACFRKLRLRILLRRSACVSERGSEQGREREG
eukprot:5177235-Alexandrium_andersonii.AAC.1